MHEWQAPHPACTHSHALSHSLHCNRTRVVRNTKQTSNCLLNTYLLEDVSRGAGRGALPCSGVQDLQPPEQSSPVGHFLQPGRWAVSIPGDRAAVQRMVLGIGFTRAAQPPATHHPPGTHACQVVVLPY